MKDAGLPIGKAAAIAKLATSETATRVSHQVEQHLYVKEELISHLPIMIIQSHMNTQAMQLMGQEGMVRGSGVERNYRDARWCL